MSDTGSCEPLVNQPIVNESGAYFIKMECMLWNIFNRKKDISKSPRWVICLSQWFISDCTVDSCKPVIFFIRHPSICSLCSNIILACNTHNLDGSLIYGKEISNSTILHNMAIQYYIVL